MEKEEYFLKVGITRTAPKTLMFFDDMANVTGNILLGVISFLLQKITGKSASTYNPFSAPLNMKRGIMDNHF